MRPFICYACFSGPRSAPVRSLKAAKPPPHARWLSMAKGMRRGLPHHWSRIGFLLFRRVLDWRRLPAERVAFAARAQEGAVDAVEVLVGPFDPHGRPVPRRELAQHLERGAGPCRLELCASEFTCLGKVRANKDRSPPARRDGGWGGRRGKGEARCRQWF